MKTLRFNLFLEPQILESKYIFEEMFPKAIPNTKVTECLNSNLRQKLQFNVCASVFNSLIISKYKQTSRILEGCNSFPTPLVIIPLLQFLLRTIKSIPGLFICHENPHPFSNITTKERRMRKSQAAYQSHAKC